MQQFKSMFGVSDDEHQAGPEDIPSTDQDDARARFAALFKNEKDWFTTTEVPLNPVVPAV